LLALSIGVASVVIVLDVAPVISSPAIPKWGGSGPQLAPIDRLHPGGVSKPEALLALDEAVTLVVIALDLCPVIAYAAVPRLRFATLGMTRMRFATLGMTRMRFATLGMTRMRFATFGMTGGARALRHIPIIANICSVIVSRMLTAVKKRAIDKSAVRRTYAVRTIFFKEL
jgi:hypothetical protein